MNNTMKLMALFLLLSPFSAHAIDDKEISECSNIKNPISRLDCFDQLSSKHSLSPTSTMEKIDSMGDWITQTDKNPFTDEVIYAAGIVAETGEGKFNKPIVMAIRCEKNKTQFFINWETYLGREKTAITYRVDRDPAKKSNWLISNDGQATIFSGSPVQLLKQISESSVFIANITPYRENSITATFNTKGAGVAFSEIRKNCNW